MLFVILVVVILALVLATPWIDRTIDRFYTKKPVEGTMRIRPVVFIDDSGSMHQSQYMEALKELNESNAVISLFEFDIGVNVVSERLWLNGHPFPESKIKFSGGGTDFQSIFDFLEEPENKGRWSSIHVVTDGYAPAPKTKIPINWIITEDGNTDCVRPGDFVNKLS